MDQSDLIRVGQVLGQHRRQCVEIRAVLGPALLELAAPPLQLPRRVGLPRSQVTQAHGVDINDVDLRQGPSQFETETSAYFGGELARGLLIVDDGSLDMFHDDDGDIGDRGILTDSDGGRHRHSGRLQCGDDPKLAGHVMGRGEEMSQRGPTGDPGPARLVVDTVGEIRLPLTHTGTAERTGHRFARVPHPAGQARQIEFDAHRDSRAFFLRRSSRRAIERLWTSSGPSAKRRVR